VIRVAHVDAIERRGRDIPVREHFGIRAFGVNAYVPGDEGRLIGEHTEAATGQEELYVVLDGTAVFEIDGERVEASAGSLVFVEPSATRKASGTGTILAIGATPGEAYYGLDWGDVWQEHRESLRAYGEQRYSDALDTVRRGLIRKPDAAGLHFNYACFASLAGEVDDELFDHLRRSVEAHPPFRAQAQADDDLAAVRDDPRFEAALA
jgi:hypothetical protein